MNPLISILVHRNRSTNREMSADNFYRSLIPCHDADKNGKYTEALNWALLGKDSENINNIAIAGPYGSGKSSIVQTYQKKNKNNNLKFINISLGTYKHNESPAQGVDPRKELQRDIEISILQQIFYHEEQKNIPNSRFQRIQAASLGKIMMRLYFASSTFIILVQILFSKWIISYLGLKISDPVTISLHRAGLALLTINTLLLAYYLVEKSSQFRVTKFKINSAEFELGKDSTKSILNDNIDEIIYFFEQTSYNVVVIEDLDRFDQAEIFTKLREINFLINNAKSIKKNVRFIYCIKDDLFKERDRTKFFDFIIPVIPFINPSNAKDILIQISNIANYGISQKVINDLSIFINEMRLLNNIINEFHIYRASLKEELSQDKLFAIIFYKNIYPNDFSLLTNNQGILYEHFQSRSKWINEESILIDEKIKQIETDITALTNTKRKSIDELNKIYAFHLLARLITTYRQHENFSIIINGNVVQPSDLYLENNFSAILNNSYTINTSPWGGQLAPIQFSTIEGAVDATETYLSKKEFIENQNLPHIQKLRSEIRELRDEKEKLSSLRIKDIIHNIPTNKITDPIIDLLLREGYIDEEYRNYISFFHEGSLTRGDFDYLINVKRRRPTAISHKLVNVNEIIFRLSKLDCADASVLNVSLFEFILCNETDEEKKATLFSLLPNGNPKCLELINILLEKSILRDKFITGLSASWPSMWEYIEEHSSLEESTIHKCFCSVINHLSIEAISIQAKNSQLSSYFSNNQQFDGLEIDANEISKVICTIGAKIQHLEQSACVENLVDTIIGAKCYEINPENLKFILCKRLLVAEALFESRNYEAIKNCGDECLIEYIDNNMQSYVRNVYLRLPKKSEDPEEFLIKILNEAIIDAHDKLEIIKNTRVEISSISNLMDDNVVIIAANEHGLASTWKILGELYTRSGNTIAPHFITFINSINVADELSKQALSESGLAPDLAHELTNSIVNCNNIEDKFYEKIIVALQLNDIPLNYDDISRAKAEIIIDCNKLPPSIDNIGFLRRYDLEIVLKFIQVKRVEIFTILKEFTLCETEIIGLLASPKFSLDEKYHILELSRHKVYSSNQRVLKVVSDIATQHPQMIPKDYRIPVIAYLGSFLQSIVNLFIAWSSDFSQDEVTSVLQYFPSPYSDIALSSKHTQLPYTSDAEAFASALKSINYISSYSVSKGKIKIIPFRNHIQ